MTAYRIRISIIAVFSFVSLNSCGQNAFLGDQIFQANKGKEEFKFESYNAIVRIGNLVNNTSKNAVIFQQIDSINYLWQLKFLSYRTNEIVEKVIDTMDMGVLVDLQFMDKDFDLNRDLVITIGGNKAVDFLYLFDKQSENLVFLEEFIWYPKTKQVGTSKFLYSYKATGCADNYWQSNLIGIQNFQVIEYGELIGNGCEDSEADNNIQVVFKDKPEPIINYDTLQHFKNNKWLFIERFWNTKLSDINK